MISFFGLHLRKNFLKLNFISSGAFAWLLSPALAAPPCEGLSAPKFSFDRQSPTVLGGIVDANSLLVPAPGDAPPNVFLSGANLGLGLNDELDALSAAYVGFDPAASFVLLFSVDRDSQGMAAPDVAAIGLGVPYNASDQAAKNQQAGDQYLSLHAFNRSGIRSTARGPVNNNVLTRNNWDEGGRDFNANPETSAADVNVLRGIEPQDNVDAMASFNANTPGDLPAVFFSIESSPTPGISGADIFVDFVPQMAGGENFFLRPNQMALLPQDDIDSLIVFDNNGNGVAEEGDQVLISLRAESPSLMILGFTPADVLSFVVPMAGSPPQPPTLFASGESLGLGSPTDRIDALELELCEDPLDCARRHGIRLTACAPAVSPDGLALLAVLLVATCALILGNQKRRATLTCDS